MPLTGLLLDWMDTGEERINERIYQENSENPKVENKD